MIPQELEVEFHDAVIKKLANFKIDTKLHAAIVKIYIDHFNYILANKDHLDTEIGDIRQATRKVTALGIDAKVAESISEGVFDDDMQTVIEKIFADVQDEISNASDKAVCEILDQLNETASLMVEVLKLQESQNKNRLFTLDVNKAEAAEKSASEAAEEKRPSSPPRF